ncbi:MAG TPA: polysaccharide lyase family 1 protein [Kineosporiaceae bacterium]|nr:polysaccharide lyase family 1 protein [Kineosporiaceae bacterium]
MSRRRMRTGSLIVLAVAAVASNAIVNQAQAVEVRSEGTLTAAASVAAAGPIGWATQSGGTTGGAGATAAHTYTVKNRKQLIAAIAGTDSAGKTDKTAPKIINWVGTIDMTEGKKYTSQADQKARAEIKLQPNTTIVGVGSNAYLPNGWLMVRGVDNIIIRNLKLTTPCDVAPKWDPDDDAGNYNSEFDGLTIDASTHVWVDHLHITDAPLTDDMLPLGNKDSKGVVKHIQCHDGSLDIKNASDFVTVSYTVFSQHLKNNLVGSSDKTTSDIGHQTITFAYNMYDNIGQRSPRVRFGKVHVVGNYFVGNKKDPVYPHSYSIGTGLKAQIISENNVFNIAGASAGRCTDVVTNPSKPSGNFKDSGSTVNGSALSGCSAPTAVNWSLPSGYSYPKIASANVKAYVLANAGPGKI